jgi:hypothetical protein
VTFDFDPTKGGNRAPNALAQALSSSMKDFVTWEHLTQVGRAAYRAAPLRGSRIGIFADPLVGLQPLAAILSNRREVGMNSGSQPRGTKNWLAITTYLPRRLSR